MSDGVLTLPENRSINGRFAPGNSANPGGRPKGLAHLVRDHTRDGAELVEFMLRILRSKRQPVRVRMEAVAWLADRGFGKVALPLEHSGTEGGPMRFTLVLSASGAPDGDLDG